MSRQQIILVPGFLCDKDIWQPQIPVLAARFSVKVVELPRGVACFREMAQHILDNAGEKFILVGHSMGAKVAMELMGMQPDRVERLVIMDTGVHTVTADEPEKRQSLINLAQKKGMEAVVDKLLPQMIHADRLGDTQLVQSIRQMMLRFPLAEMKNQIAASLGREDHRLVLPGIKCPTLIMCGAQDAWSPVSQHQEIEQGISNSLLRVLENAGHMITLEAPGEVSRMLVDWIR